MATQIIRPTNREEWLDVRKSGIGSSEVATIQDTMKAREEILYTE